MLLTLDFESYGIQPRPDYPPRPVGVALYRDNGKPLYYAWGHPTNNNCTEEEAQIAVSEALHKCTKVIMHNAMFDCAILEEQWGMSIPWHKVEDTMVMAFIDNPHGELSLKPLTAELLNLPPIEQDAVEQWLVANGVVRANSKQWGAFIAYAPGDLVGEYAKSDVERTYQLYCHYLTKWRTDAKSYNAYRREMSLMPYIYDMDKQGVKIDVVTLAKDLQIYNAELIRLDEKICSILGATIDVDSNESLADALEAAGKSKGFSLTATGKRSVAKGSLISAINDPGLLGALLIRNSLATCIRTFMQPWYDMASIREDNKIFIRWNQVRNYSDTGARTGRLSSSPNLQNVPTLWEQLIAQLEKLGYILDIAMPQVRKYIIPEPGNIFVSRDFSGQEMRLLAHFAGGNLLKTLQNKPDADVHMIAASIANISRRVAKTLGFAVLYGAGVGRIAETLGISAAEASEIKANYLNALPEIASLQKDVQYRGRNGMAITTLGGRHYFVEEPKLVKGRVRTFEYKLINYLIQGSAADQTKAAMEYYCKNTKHGKLLLSVHDELVIECPIEHQEEESQLLSTAMATAFSDILEYTSITTETRGFNFGEL